MYKFGLHTALARFRERQDYSTVEPVDTTHRIHLHVHHDVLQHVHHDVSQHVLIYERCVHVSGRYSEASRVYTYYVASYPGSLCSLHVADHGIHNTLAMDAILAYYC